MSLGADAIATGHYARVRYKDGKVQLLKAVDASKDQSYFLHRLTQRQLANVMFPLEITKTEVRKIAEQIGLHNAKKKDSTGICFIGERPFREFLNRYLPRIPGPIKTPESKIVGEHMGLAFFTLGQRKGIGLGGSQDGNSDAWYVARKDIPNNTLYVVQGHEHPWLLAQKLSAMDASWVSGSVPTLGNYSAKTRYRQADSACSLSAGHEPQDFELNFLEAQWAVTPGQSAVLYDGDICLGAELSPHKFADY